VTYVLHVTRRTAGHLISDDYYQVETEYAAREAGLGMLAAAEGGPDTIHYAVAELKELPR